jgi:hypothetical protein
MERSAILRAIKKTAEGNGGSPLGMHRFASETGIRRHEWYGKYWTSWGEALAEAGFAPNELAQAVPEDEILLGWLKVADQVGRFPTDAQIRMASRRDPAIPSHSTMRKLGRNHEVAAKLAAYAEANGRPDIAALCRDVPKPRQRSPEAMANGGTTQAPGFVYMIKHGSRDEYKIGYTLDPLRRLGEIGLQLPHAADPVHTIETDDPSGVEAYWHRRFSDKRLRGEWFKLTPADVAAFKRWKRIA